MVFKKHNWLRYGGTSEIVEIIIRDFNGGKRDSFKCNNSKDFARVIKMIKEKTNLGKEIEVNIEEKKEDWEDPNFKW